MLYFNNTFNIIILINHIHPFLNTFCVFKTPPLVVFLNHFRWNVLKCVFDFLQAHFFCGEITIYIIPVIIVPNNFGIQRLLKVQKRRIIALVEQTN